MPCSSMTPQLVLIESEQDVIRYLIPFLFKDKRKKEKQLGLLLLDVFR